MFDDLVDYPSNILKNVRKTNKTPPQGVKGVVGKIEMAITALLTSIYNLQHGKPICNAQMQPFKLGLVNYPLSHHLR